jgi:hypothetical protein
VGSGAPAAPTPRLHIPTFVRSPLRFPMPYGFLADLVVVLHLGFVAFVALGALLVFRWRRLLPVHVAGAAWGAYFELAGKVCPLTPLENALRRRAGEAGYHGDFVEHYLLPLLYTAGLTADVQLVLGLGVIVLNLALYALLWRRLRRRPGGA